MFLDSSTTTRLCNNVLKFSYKFTGHSETTTSVCIVPFSFFLFRDYLSIVDHGQTIGKFCNETSEMTLNTTGSKVIINFMSNGDGIQSKSFKIDYKLGKSNSKVIFLVLKLSSLFRFIE